MPRMISSSVERPQFSASRLTRKVLETAGQPLRLISAFQVPDAVFVMVAIRHLKIGRCTDIVLNEVLCQIGDASNNKLYRYNSLILIV